MKYLVPLITGLFIFGLVIVRENRSERSVSHSNQVAIAGNTENEDLKYLIANSKLAVAGRPEEIFYVVDDEKMKGNKSAPKGIVQLPNLREAVKGILVRFRIEELIHSQQGQKPRDFVDIYVPNGYSVPTDSNIPVFEKEKRYLVFLSALEKGDYVKGTSVILPTKLSKGRVGFDHRSALKVTAKNYGYFRLTNSNTSLLTQARRAAANQK